MCNHEYTLTETKAATCTENGKETYICDLCEHKKTETIKATGHTMDGNQCTVCGYVETKENNENTSKPTMKDIEAWYVADISNVGKDLADYAPTKVSGLSDFKIKEIHFFFGN
jgi:rubredoxin